MPSLAEDHPALIKDDFQGIEALIIGARIVQFFKITYDKRVVFHKRRGTEMTVSLGRISVASYRKGP